MMDAGSQHYEHLILCFLTNHLAIFILAISVLALSLLLEPFHLHHGLHHFNVPSLE